MKSNKIHPDSSEYLQIIGGIANAPKRLCYAGSLPNTRQPTVAIVGTRKPTAYGREVAYQLAYTLAQQGFVIVSGLALGTDAIAHRAALDAGGITIAVLPGPVDAVYPRSHHALARDIVTKGGALISEYQVYDRIYPINFIARNRIVSGISDGLLITEASAKSGTMHTTNFALEQGKVVMAVPGNITSPLSQGCNNLIKSGAVPVTSAKEVPEALGLDQRSTQTTLPLGDTPQEQTLLQLLTQGVRDGNELQKLSGMSAAQFNQTLTMLEIHQKVRALGANQWSLK